MSPRIAPGNNARRGAAAATLVFIAAVILLLVAYPFIVSGELGTRYPWLANMLTVVLLAIVSSAALPGTWRIPGVIAIAAVAAATIASGAGAALHYLPPILINLGLAALFGGTLRAGHEPIVSRFARMERGTLAPDLVQYTRSLTRVWTIFFIAMGALSAALAFSDYPTAWQWFTVAGNWLCVAALFCGEWFYRRLRFPHHPHVSPARMVALVRERWRA